MDRTMVARELVRIAESLVAEDFPSKDALDEYLHEHPGADRSNHRVVETKKDSAGGDDVDKERAAIHKGVADGIGRALAKHSPSGVKVDFKNSEGGEVSFSVKTDLHPGVKRQYREDFESPRRYVVKVNRSGSGYDLEVGAGPSDGSETHGVGTARMGDKKPGAAAVLRAVSEIVGKDLKKSYSWDDKPKKSS